jgi:hypothetical protein
MSNSEGQKAQMHKQADEAARERLSERWPELAHTPYKGLSVYGTVMRAAEEALAATVKNREELEQVRMYCLGFISGFDILSLDFGVTPKSQVAALRAIFNALMIGMSLGDPKLRDKIVSESRRIHTAKMRAAKQAKSGPVE